MNKEHAELVESLRTISITHAHLSFVAHAALKVENLHDAVGTIRQRENLLPQLNAAISEPKFGFASKRARGLAHLESGGLKRLGKSDE